METKNNENSNSNEIKNDNILSVNNSKNSVSTNGSSVKEKDIEHKKTFDKGKDEERRLKMLILIEERRKSKELEIKKERDRIRKIELLVTTITSNRNGLENLGNTCYMNTCLQLLIHCTPFLLKLFKEGPKEKLSKEFYDLCNNQLNECSTPKNLKILFGNKHRRFKGIYQQDTQEFCRLFLEDISTEMNRVKIIPPYIELDYSNKNKIELNNEYDKIFRRREDSIIVDTFYSQIINIFQCKCGFESYSYEKILDIPLLFIGNGTQKVNNLLEKFFQSDIIDWGVECKNCGKIEKHKKIVKIASPPEILILSLQRYEPKTKKKNNCEVKFTEELDIKKYSDIDCCGEFSTKYHLIGIANHNGDLNFGHYFAFINIDKKWFEFNDDSSFPCEKVDKSSENAYILFYERE